MVCDAVIRGTARGGRHIAVTIAETQAPQLWIWRIDMDAPYPQGLLAPAELARAARFVRPADRAAHAAAHAGLRAILGACLGLPPSTLVFDAAAMGKPFLAVPDGSGLHFNLSHSKGLAALGMARFPLGVDVEAMRRIDDGLAATVFSPMELEELAALPSDLRQAGFFRGWTRKEAFVKALGSGLSAPLDRFTVSLSPDAPARLRDIDWAPGEAAAWQITHVSIGHTHVGAVAAHRRGWRLDLAPPEALRQLGLAPSPGEISL
ncbi:MAG TPA: 4'-phosphopantetheinyl transferase superfamily protein [Roseomonas sp.]|jgi:4'-phosphopantetheinyl transferase